MDSERLLLSYPALGFVGILRRRRPGISLLRANLLLVSTCTVFLVVSSAVDETLYLEEGTGMLEHPAIWIFLTGQAILPSMLRIAIRRFFLMAESDLFKENADVRSTIARLKQDLGRRSSLSRSTYSGLALMGLAAWIWNSYQNQLPYEMLGADFWDSRLHPAGYWLTRVYKLYVWTLLIPLILHVQLMIAGRAYGLLRVVRAKSSVRLQPFHPDGSGGAAVIARAVITPLVPALLLGAALNFAVAFVHGKVDPTTLGSGLLFLATVIAFYLVPAKALRDMVANEKEYQLVLISRAQGGLYKSLLDVGDDPRAQEAASRLRLLADLTQGFNQIHLWPGGLRVAKAIVSYIASPVVALVVKEAAEYTKLWIS